MYQVWYDDDSGGSEEESDSSAISRECTVKERLYDLESDAESGWQDENRHRLSLVRVPDTFLAALQSQVQPCRAKYFYLCFFLLQCRISTCAISLGQLFVYRISCGEF
jgi:hypothetical protein